MSRRSPHRTPSPRWGMREPATTHHSPAGICGPAPGGGVAWESNRPRRWSLHAPSLCHSFWAVKIHPVKVYSSAAKLPKTEQLAWKIAQVAAEDVPILPDVAQMV